MMKSSKAGVNLQIGVEVDVSVEKGPATVSGTVPPIFKRAWGKSRDVQKIQTSFTKKSGIVAVSSAKCQLYEIKINTDYGKLPFMTQFQNAIKHLNRLSNAKSDIKVRGFRKFIKIYGTHFLKRTIFGAEMAHRTVFSNSIKKNFKKDKIAKCEYVKGAEIFGIQVKESTSGCSKEDMQQLYYTSDSALETTRITKGGRPDKSFDDWAKQEFTAVPLKYELSPIINLFKKNYLDNELKVSAEKILEWFAPLYINFCQSMYGSPCVEEKGCGFDDKCPADTDCEADSKENYCTGKKSFLECVLDANVIYQRKYNEVRSKLN